MVFILPSKCGIIIFAQTLHAAKAKSYSNGNRSSQQMPSSRPLTAKLVRAHNMRNGPQRSEIIVRII